MSDLKTQARALGDDIKSRKAVAAQKWADFNALRESAKSEGVDFAKDADAFAKIDAAGKEYDTIRQEVSDMESKWVRLMELAGEQSPQGGKAFSDEPTAKTVGEMFTKSAAFDHLTKRLAGSAAIGATESVKVLDRAALKTLIGVSIGDTIGSGIVQPDRQGFMVMTPLAPLNLLDLITIGSTDSDLVEWIEETVYTNAAAETAEGNAAPESTVKWDTKTTGVKDITHFIPFTRRAMHDVAFVESQVNARLIDGVRRRLQTQVLGGDGLGDNLKGIYNTSGIGSVDRSVTGLNLEDSLHAAITTIRTTAFDEPTFIGINPEDYQTYRLRKETGGAYINGAPSISGPLTMWGLPLVVHAGFTAGTPLVGIGRDAHLWVREGLSVSASDSHEDYFTKKKIAVMASMRAAFAVVQAKSFAVSVA